MAEKARYWCAIAYPENMVDDWQDKIGSVLQMAYEYSLHDKDLEQDGKTSRKDHLHIILPFAGPTTLNNVLTIVNKLSKPGSTCCSTAEVIINMNYMHNYLIHDSDDCRKKHKFQYDNNVRVSGNGFDIGTYEQISLQDKIQMTKELCDTIVKTGFTNFIDFYTYVSINYDTRYFEILESKSGLFERLTKGNFQKKITDVGKPNSKVNVAESYDIKEVFDEVLAT